MMKLVRVEELFEVKYGNSLELINCEETKNGIPFVSRTSKNNGVSAYIERVKGEESNPANTITVAVGGSVMESFLQDEAYYTGFHVMILQAKEAMSKIELLYYCSALRMNKYRFSYGLQANKFLKSLLIPSKEAIPHWVYQETFPKIDPNPLHSTKAPLLDTSTWRSFKYEEIFVIKNGFYNKKPLDSSFTSKSNLIPFIGASDSNNGVTSWHTLGQIEEASKTGDGVNHPLEKKLFQGNCITVSNNGSVGYAFYQRDEFTCSHDINVLYLKNYPLNSYLALFICGVIGMDKYRWQYGRKWRPIRMPSSIIKLPITKEGTPDWQFMEDYIKALPYSANI